ncbi:hypothetical protein BDA99DRAFT_542721 [Phascolomyces articulosus]|uniref:Uncharacterized protein n=1 Tax=Phascolomyces articulosus TaxID=60185 RepID=A0AAD5P8G1_9FUNG|nr:hypothetical protein BDA99DRAFT_542721 [Phascolomyces articulosus]
MKHVVSDFLFAFLTSLIHSPSAPDVVIAMDIVVTISGSNCIVVTGLYGKNSRAFYSAGSPIVTLPAGASQTSSDQQFRRWFAFFKISTLPFLNTVSSTDLKALVDS